MRTATPSVGLAAMLGFPASACRLRNSIRAPFCGEASAFGAVLAYPRSSVAFCCRSSLQSTCTAASEVAGDFPSLMATRGLRAPELPPPPPPLDASAPSLPLRFSVPGLPERPGLREPPRPAPPKTPRLSGSLAAIALRRKDSLSLSLSLPMTRCLIDICRSRRLREDNSLSSCTLYCDGRSRRHHVPPPPRRRHRPRLDRRRDP